MWRGASTGITAIVAVDTCETTMETVRGLVESEVLGDWGALVSGVQTGGRGQLRRPWASLPGNLHASIALPDAPVRGEWAEALAPLLPLVVGYVVCSVLEEQAAGLKIKWPNDILQDGRKVGGMLIEERNGKSILGLGLNLAGFPPEEELREDHSVPAAKMAIPYPSGGPLTLLERLVNRGKSVYEIMLDEIPPTRFIAMVESRLAWMGRTIRVLEGNEAPYEAVVTGLSLGGGLVVLREGDEKVLYSGSISPL
ncbi:hypothetical protein JCM14722_01660 [Pseudodesulfovibrio portus]|uniref:BPL/LPL catalytic domain-containing protein n=2 Tax=Pseudodesulfovibrio portus TaxID=231439 RepID=A0ABM8AMN4_9BACT|nr:hypothetical protein JCM14722_01660 [Pseudodesulfovibrio portus]